MEELAQQTPLPAHSQIPPTRLAILSELSPTPAVLDPMSANSGENLLLSITDELGVHVPQALKERGLVQIYNDLSKLLVS